MERQKEGGRNITRSQETLEIMASVDHNQPVINILPNSTSGEGETCVLYMDSDEFARQV